MLSPGFIVVAIIVLVIISVIVFERIKTGSQAFKEENIYTYQTSFPPQLSGNADAINALIVRLPSTGGQVSLTPGVYTIDKNIWINKSNITIKGVPGATKLILANNVNEPFVSIGSRSLAPNTTIDNITLDGLILDGNLSGQTSQTSTSAVWLKNDIVSIRAATNVIINNCELINGIASGVSADYTSTGFRFISSKSVNMTVNSVIIGNATNSIMSDFIIDTTLSSHALVINNTCSNTSIIDGKIINAYHDGISVTNCSGISINDIVISSNGGNGISINDSGVGKGSSNVSIFSCKIYNNATYGFAVNSVSTISTNIAIAGAVIGPGNAAGNTFTVVNGSYSAVGIVLF